MKSLEEKKEKKEDAAPHWSEQLLNEKNTTIKDLKKAIHQAELENK